MHGALYPDRLENSIPLLQWTGHTNDLQAINYFEDLAYKTS